MAKENVVSIYNGVLALKKKKILPLVATWMKLEDFKLSDISQSQKAKYCVILLI